MGGTTVSHAPVRSSLVQAGLWTEPAVRGHFMLRPVQGPGRGGRFVGSGASWTAQASAQHGPRPQGPHPAPVPRASCWLGSHLQARNLLELGVTGSAGRGAGWGRAPGEGALGFCFPSVCLFPTSSRENDRGRGWGRTDIPLGEGDCQRSPGRLAPGLALLLASWLHSRY